MRLIGILNTTPDSFSDGGKYFELESAIQHAESMIAAGADIIDIGGDSTRPGSDCVGPKLEQERVLELVNQVTKLATVSVDTHFASTAAAALQCGAKIINDVSAGHDPEMFSVLASSDAKMILMHSACSAPHVFDYFKQLTTDNVVDEIRRFFDTRVNLALKAGLNETQLILDPGMGAFISRDPAVSWQMLKHFGNLSSNGLPLVLGASRKGFLKLANEVYVEERDALSAVAACLAAKSCDWCFPHYLRVHNVALHREVLKRAL